MDEEQALLRAIIADRDDDTVRLAYADWLDEHDQPERAAFIRVQIELARVALSEPRGPLEERERELFDALRWARLRHECPPEINRFAAGSHFDYHRGFLARIELDAGPTDDTRPFSHAQKRNEFVRFAPLLFTHFPIEELRLGPSVGVDWYSQQIWDTYLSAEMVRELANVPELDRLWVLEVSGPARDIDEVCRAVLENSHFRNLRRLYIRNRFEALPDEGWSVHELAPDTKSALRSAFGDRVVWDV